MRTSTLVNKARRIGTLVDAKAWLLFLSGEALGYDSEASITTKHFLVMVHRWDGRAEQFTAMSCSGLEENCALWETQIDAHKSFQPSGQYAALHHQGRMDNIMRLSNSILLNKKIIGAVRATVYHLATMVLNERLFSRTSHDIFSIYQAEVDKKLVQLSETAFAKLPDVFERLEAGSSEAISHALTSCRRIIDAFADSVFPPQEAGVIVNGEMLDCGPGKPKNRILGYIAEKQVSKSRAHRLKRGLFDLYDRVSSGVHADVAPSEAQALVLQTYTLLGEIGSL